MRMKPCVEKWDEDEWHENEALHLIMMIVKHCKKNNKYIYKKKLKNKNFNLLPIPPVFFGPCPCNVPWNRNQKIIKGKFSTDQDHILRFRTTDNNLHWSLSIHPHQLPRLPFSLPLGPPFLFLLLSLILCLFLHFLSLCTSENLRYFIK